MKYSKEFKLMCIEMYYRGEYPETPEGEKKKRFHDTIKDWVRMSEKAGIESVEHKGQNRKWTPEENKMDTSRHLPGDVHEYLNLIVLMSRIWGTY